MTIGFPALSGLAALPVSAVDGDRAIGVRRNAKNFVHVEAHRCGQSGRGRIVSEIRYRNGDELPVIAGNGLLQRLTSMPNGQAARRATTLAAEG